MRQRKSFLQNRGFYNCLFLPKMEVLPFKPSSNKAAAHQAPALVAGLAVEGLPRQDAKGPDVRLKAFEPPDWCPVPACFFVFLPRPKNRPESNTSMCLFFSPPLDPKTGQKAKSMSQRTHPCPCCFVFERLRSGFREE